MRIDDHVEAMIAVDAERKRLGLRLIDLVEQTGMSMGTISNGLRGKQWMGLPAFVRLARACGLEVHLVRKGAVKVVIDPAGCRAEPRDGMWRNAE